ncbi:hypothetical protein FMO003_14660 [Moritella sp. F3]|nr:hypothetical protein FMO001_28990 [Moritella sp. F1]GIC81185.1 hypothetical protein FMO003_14660 [Moritella sp. F3]
MIADIITINTIKFIEKVDVTNATDSAINKDNTIDEMIIVFVVNFNLEGLFSKTINFDNKLDSGNINTDKYNALVKTAVNAISIRSNELNI